MQTGGLRGRHAPPSRGRQRPLVQQLRFASGHQLWAPCGWRDRGPQAGLRYMGQHRQRGFEDGLHRRDGKDPSPARHRQGNDNKYKTFFKDLNRRLAIDLGD